MYVGSRGEFIKEWDTVSWVCLRTLLGPTEKVYSGCMCMDGKRLYLDNCDGTVGACNLKEGLRLGIITWCRYIRGVRRYAGGVLRMCTISGYEQQYHYFR